jgi:hypothetical protein
MRLLRVGDHRAVAAGDLDRAGVSGKPTSTGWGPERIGRAWAKLMNPLGYSRYVA